MKKKMFIIFIFIYMLFLFIPKTIHINMKNDLNNYDVNYIENFSNEVSGDEYTNETYDYTDEFNDIKDNVNKELLSLIPDDTKKIVDENIKENNFLDAVQNFDILSIFDIVKNEILKYIKDPFNIFVNTLVVILITAIFHSFKDNFLKDSLKQVITYISGIYIITFLALPMLEIIENVEKVIINSNTFMISFIPFFGYFLTAAGKPISSGVYTSILFLITQVISFCISNFLLPILTLFFAFCLCGSINNSFNIIAITEGVKKIVIISLCVLITCFVSLLSFQSVISNSADGLLLKTGKFMLGNFIPFVGGALSDALTSVYGYMGLIKNGIGIFCVIVILLNFIPLLVQLGLTFLFTYISEIISDILGVKEISIILKSINSTVTITIAILVSILIVTITSFSLLLVVGGI